RSSGTYHHLGGQQASRGGGQVVGQSCPAQRGLQPRNGRDCRGRRGVGLGIDLGGVLDLQEGAPKVVNVVADQLGVGSVSHSLRASWLVESLSAACRAALRPNAEPTIVPSALRMFHLSRPPTSSANETTRPPTCI